MWSDLQVVLFVGLSIGVSSYSFAEVQTEQMLRPIEVRAKKGQAKSIEVSEIGTESLDVDPNSHPSLTQVLQNSSSIYAAEGGTTGAPHIILRSQDPQENRYFLEGVPLTDAQFNADAIAVLPFQSIARIDLYPDGVPVGLATDGLGGAIDFHLAEVTEPQFTIKSGSYGYLELTGKSFLSGEKGSVVLNGIRSNEDFIYYDNGGTPFNPSAGTLKRREHNKFYRLGVVPKFVIYRSDRSSIQYFGINSFRKLDIPGTIQVPMNGNLIQAFHLSALTGEHWLTNRLKNKNILYARINDEEYQTENKTKSPSSLGSNKTLDRGLGLRGQFQWYHFHPVALENTFAANFEIYQLKPLKDNGQRVTHQRWDIPLSLSLSFPIDDWTFKPAVISQLVIYQGQIEKRYGLSSPRLAIDRDRLFNIKGLKWENTIGRYYRAPSMLEINGTVVGISASPDLMPETAYKASTGLSLLLNPTLSWLSELKLSYCFAVALSKNLITYLQNSQNSQVATNVGESFLESHETNLQANLFKLGFSQLGMAFVTTKNFSELPYYYGKEIPNRPVFRLREKLGYQTRSFGVSYQLQWIGQRYWDLANEKRLSATTDHGVSLNWSHPSWGQINIEALNIFDTVTAPTWVSGLQTIDNTTGYFGYPAPGRRLYLSWLYEL